MRGPVTFPSLLLVAVLTVLPAAGDGPGRWRISPSESQIVFEYQSNGRPAEGTFERFSGQGSFRQEAPGAATFDLSIQSGSIDLGDSKASAFATSAEWFDSANHSDVVYSLRELTHLEADRYRAVGDLTIRGKTRPVTTTITLEIGAREAHASGTLTVDRKDFGLGVGPMSLFVDIGPQVSVHFDLTAHPLG